MMMSSKKPLSNITNHANIFRTSIVLERLPQIVSSRESALLQARDEFMEDLSQMHGQRFRSSLRVKGVQGHPDVFEMTWAGDG